MVRPLVIVVQSAQIALLADARAAEATVERQTAQCCDPDALYPQAEALVRQAGAAGITFLMRRMDIPYSCALELMSRLEKNRIVSPFSFKTGWTVLCESEG